MEVYVCVTLYHVYITLLYLFSERKMSDSIVLLNANNEKIYRQFEYIAEQMKKNGISCDVRLRTLKGEITGAERRKNKEQLAFVKKQLRDRNRKGFTLFNFAWNNSYVYSTVGLLYRECREAVFIEESTLIAKLPTEKRWKTILHKLLGDKVDFYKDSKLKEIRVQNPNIFPTEWRDKITKLDMNFLMSGINGDDRNLIIQIMSQDGMELVDLLKENGVGVGIVYTNPFSEQGYISEEAKIDYITKICNLYKNYGKVVLKLHPRDTTVYPVDDDIKILPAMFPSELLSLTGYKFAFAVAICSSAVTTTNAAHKINMNENFLIDKKIIMKDIDGNII